jgi:lactoylglutathione lyase
VTLDFAYTILYVSDVASTVAFYEQAFGIKPAFIHDSGAYAELATGQTTLAFAEHGFASDSAGVDGGCRRNDPGEQPAGLNLTLTTPDPHAAYQQALQAGATDVHEPITRPWGQVVGLVRDDNGVLVEIATPCGASTRTAAR